ncbi:MAG: helix-turn-helix domain-containing protein [Shinella sp.]|uniref:helix-turn-helix domain-containing protein n=1 Tax=Shinella sp. TaxID=1870904 RepID=UPI0040370D97
MHQFIVPHRRSSSESAPPVAMAPETKGLEPEEDGPRVRRRMSGQAAPVVVPAVACRIVRQLVLEMTAMASERPLWRRDSRRSTCHVRQIAMYVCHVVLRLSQSDIGVAFGRDRTTVGHACNRVEDRRDDVAFDAFVSAIERVVQSVFGPAGIGSHE